MDQSNRRSPILSNARTKCAIRPMSGMIRCEGGSTTVQQAVFIALIIGIAFLALDGLGLVARNTFQTASGQLAAGTPQRTEPTTQLAANDIHVSNPNATPNGQVHTNYSASTRLIVLLVVCPLGAFCWYFLYQRTRRKVVEEAPATSPQTDSQIERDLVFDKRHNLLRLFNADIGMLVNSRITVRHVMSANLQTVAPDTSIDEIQAVMREKKIRHVLVCDRKNRLLGVITIRALESTSAKTAREVMSADPPTVNPTSLLNPAITQLVKQRLYCLPVVEGEELVGVLTTTDVMMALQCTLHALQRSAQEAVADLPPDMVPGFMVALEQEEDKEHREMAGEPVAN